MAFYYGRGTPVQIVQDLQIRGSRVQACTRKGRTAMFLAASKLSRQVCSPPSCKAAEDEALLLLSFLYCQESLLFSLLYAHFCYHHKLVNFTCWVHYRGTSLITCGVSANACLFLNKLRNFSKNACLFLGRLDEPQKSREKKSENLPS